MPVTGSKLSALTAITPAAPDHVYIIQGGNSRKVLLSALQSYIGAPIASHLLETDPTVHSAAKISYSGTVPSSANVKEALEVIESRVVEASAVTADLAAIDTRTDRLEDLFGGNRASVDNYVGAGTRTFWEDDFRYDTDAAGGSYGEKGWLKGGVGTVAVGTQSPYHPGVRRISTGTVINSYTALYAPGTLLAATSMFELNMWFRAPAHDANTSYRCGLTTADSTQTVAAQQTPTEGLWVEHLGSDPAFWFNNSVSSARVQTTVATSANAWIHVHMYRASATHVATQYNVSVAGVPGTTSIAEFVPFAPTATYLTPFVSVKNLDASNKSVDIDRCGLLVVDLNR